MTTTSLIRIGVMRAHSPGKAMPLKRIEMELRGHARPWPPSRRPPKRGATRSPMDSSLSRRQRTRPTTPVSSTTQRSPIGAGERAVTDPHEPLEPLENYPEEVPPPRQRRNVNLAGSSDGAPAQKP
ncbi:hypothetical protein [Streptomyces sp. NPDC058603]|uniref:hypothetical protein n=1 Tax=Streptomyces sp. NPDC058603 TaxID=3346551 RepID=UPI003650F541